MNGEWQFTVSVDGLYSRSTDEYQGVQAVSRQQAVQAVRQLWWRVQTAKGEVTNLFGDIQNGFPYLQEERFPPGPQRRMYMEYAVVNAWRHQLFERERDNALTLIRAILLASQRNPAASTEAHEFLARLKASELEPDARETVQLLGELQPFLSTHLADAVVRHPSDEDEWEVIVPKHSPDFRSVDWFGETYTFSPIQAACVKFLWEAWENGTPEVGDSTILTSVESNSERLPLVFRDHPAWNAMIVAGTTKGTHRLADPFENAAD